jgi:hypothetical protein
VRREFQLPEDDEAGLAARGLIWEAVIENKSKLLIFPEYPIPEGYNHRSVGAGSAFRRLIPMIK